MNLPSKTVSYNESIISKFPIVLRKLTEDGMSVSMLYNSVAENMTNISEFVNVLNCLYVLGKIDIEGERVVLCRVSKS